MFAMPIPVSRVVVANQRAVDPRGDYVLYWMTAQRRAAWNFALDHALEWCRELARPLVVLEPLRCDYRWSSPRLHSFLLQGMEANRRAFAGTPALYWPYAETERDAGKGLLEAAAGRACLVVGDETPAFFLPRMAAAAATRLSVRLELVDGCGLLPLRVAPRAFDRAVDFRRCLQRELPRHLGELPDSAPFAAALPPRLGRLPATLAERWPSVAEELILARPEAVGRLPLAHQVSAVELRGGGEAGGKRLREFVERALPRYAEQRNEPRYGATSGLSPYLHFGHLSSHEVLAALADNLRWNPSALRDGGRGERQGWWGMTESAEAFLDQLVTWRELGFNFLHFRDDGEEVDSLPQWARATLAKHAGDPRPQLYRLAQFEAAATHDALWNAAQTQLTREGTIHGYLRMLWGKKILEWSATPQEALAVMIELNNKYALDGRDPNSLSGIFWCLGRYDRPWGPERPIFGTVRYMSSENTARKMDVKLYLKRYGPARQPGLFGK